MLRDVARTRRAAYSETRVRSSLNREVDMQPSADVLAIFAHPDDETFSSGGTFAALTDAGHAVTLVCATRGEVGEISDPALATPETLAAVREQELRSAMEIVGVDDIRFLDFRDSGMAGTDENHDPRAFVNADDQHVIAQLAAILRELRPAIVITFGPDGIYGHPDHLKIHRVATEAVVRYGSTVAHGPALYYQAIPRERIIEMAKRDRGPFSQMSEEELARFGVPLAEITTVIDVSAQYDRKLAAIGAHKTQFPTDGPFSELPPDEVRSFLATERFQLVDVPWDTVPGDPLLAAVGVPVARCCGWEPGRERRSTYRALSVDEWADRALRRARRGRLDRRAVGRRATAWPTSAAGGSTANAARSGRCAASFTTRPMILERQMPRPRGCPSGCEDGEPSENLAAGLELSSCQARVCRLPCHPERSRGTSHSMERSQRECAYPIPRASSDLHPGEIAMRDHDVYILSNASKTLYIGMTNNLEVRWDAHRRKTGSGFTRAYNVTMLVYVETYTDPLSAIAREKQLKNWTRAKKIALIEKSNPQWLDLSADRIPEI
jgi:LmbE family N-acetylglucosaminyl deacetylase/predicted GIY-YIG superfamily endonuclease